MEQLAGAEDPALVLHLTSLILFQAVTQTMLHASGRFVSNILTYLQSHLTADVFNTLQWYHGKFHLKGVGLGETCSPRVQRFAGSNPAEVDGFFQDLKILSTSPPGRT